MTASIRTTSKRHRMKSRTPTKPSSLKSCSSTWSYRLETCQKRSYSRNLFVYRDECLKKILIPFVRANHRHDRYVFWPDLASAHYAKSVQDYLKKEGIPYVAKVNNPANVPKARPIEDFWGLLKQKVYEGGWQAKSLKELKNKITWCFPKSLCFCA